MSSPFKFLDAYDRNDRDIFFGREQEIENLYCLMFEANLALVYGQSGTGKTSLIQCGLANRFQPTDWFQLFVRRQEDINAALNREIRANASTPIPAEASVVEAVRSLYLDHLRPITLIFDQFEELFILGSAGEQEAFIATVAALLASDVSCKIIISLREEYLASLNRFEKAVPILFNKRLRVEPMSMANLRRVITGTACHLGIVLENGEATAQKIIDNLDDPRAGVQLAYLQVYLDRLWRLAQAESADGPIVFTDEAVAETGKLDNVMEHFLEEQIAAIQTELAAKHPEVDPPLVRHLLEEFVTVEGTKQPMSRADLAARAPKAEPYLNEALAALQRVRILRSSDALFELSHDSLAGLIAERRGADRKALLLVRKMVRDRLEEKTLLNSAELARVSRNQPQLDMTEAETAFVRKSYVRRRFRRGGWIGGAILAFLTLIIVDTIGDMKTEETLIRAQRDTDELIRSAALQLDMDPRTALARVSIRQTARERINAMAQDSDVEGARDPDFWQQLHEADIAFENGRRPDAMRTYGRLLAEQERLLPDDATGFSQMKVERVLTRMVYAEPDRGRRMALSRRLLSVVASGEIEGSILHYRSARFQACNQLRADRAAPPECEDVRDPDDPEGRNPDPDTLD